MNLHTENGRLKLYIAGVGGQGVLTMARFLGEAALSVKLNVVVGQLHGMSQRGGSVTSTVLFGPGQSSFIAEGQADVVVGLEPLETLRSVPKMSDRTIVLLNRDPIIPFLLAHQGIPYPDFTKILSQIRTRTDKVHELQGPTLTEKIGSSRSLNFVMLGALSGLAILPFDPEVLRRIIQIKSPARFVETNLRAYTLGKESLESTLKE